MHISQLTRLVSLEVREAPVTLLEYTLLDACRVWAKATWGLERTVVVETSVGEGTVPLLLANDAEEIFAVKQVTNNTTGNRLVPSGHTSAMAQHVSEGEPTFYEYRNGLMLYPTPSKQFQLTAIVAVRPKKSASEVDDYFREFENAVAHYAKYRLFAQAGQVWTNLDAAAVNYRQYKMCLSEEKLRIMRGNTNTEMKVIPRAFV